MDLRLGLDRAARIATPQTQIDLPAPPEKNNQSHAHWLALMRALVDALPEAAVLRDVPRKDVVWMGRAIAMAGLGWGAYFAISEGLNGGALIVGGGTAAMAGFLAWGAGAFRGPRELDRAETSLQLLNQIIFRERAGARVPVAPAPVANPAPTAAAPTRAPVNDAIDARRRWAYATLGCVSDDVIAPIISPSLLGAAPAWPQREAHAMVRPSDGRLLILTNGLTDAFHDGGAGLATEFALSLPAPATAQDDFATAQSSPEFALLRELCFNALTWPDLRGQLQDQPALSVELPAEIGTPYATSEGAVGLLIGQPTLLQPEDDWSLLPVAVLLPEELLAVRDGGAPARTRLAEGFAASQWLSTSDRAPFL